MATLLRNALAHLPIRRIPIAAVPAAVCAWISAHPGQTALIVTNGVIVFTPAALTIPLLGAMGFGASGPITGGIAVWVQSLFGNVAAGGVFATLQSAAMGGYGAGIVNGMAQGGAVAAGAVTTWLRWKL